MLVLGSSVSRLHFKLGCGLMSILDSFASPDEVAPSPAPKPPTVALSGLSVLDTFAVDEPHIVRQQPPLDARNDPHGGLSDRPVDREVPAPLEQAEPQVTSGRKKGSTAEALSLRRLLSGAAAKAPARQAEPRSRQEICTAAGKARQRKRQGLAVNPPEQSLPQQQQQPSGSAPVQALVPWSSFARADLSLFCNTEAQMKVMQWQPSKPLGKNHNKKVEAGIFQSGLNLLSKSELAKKLAVSRKTVTQRMRLLAVCTFLVRKLRTEQRFEECFQVLSLLLHGERASKELFILKYKYDEMSLKCRALVKGKVETSVTKLLQVQLWWIALFYVAGRFVRYRAPLPTSITTVEACSVNCFRKALDCHVQFPQVATEYQRKTRLPLADKHATNTAVDFSYARDYPEEILHKFNCFVHVEHKVADKTCEVYPNEKKGLLHSCLSINFAGSLSTLKASLKKLNRQEFVWIDATCGPGADEDAYRESVFKQCCEATLDDHREVSTGFLIIVQRRRKLWNGRYRRCGKTEHFCFSRLCCRDANHCLEQMDAAIDDEPGPGDWCPSRFMRIEDTVDWELFWQLCHGLLPLAVEDSFGDSVAAKKQEADDPMSALLAHPLESEDHESDHDWHMPEDDIGLEEPLKDQTHEQRQSTFRKNTVVWIRSKPAGRLWCFKSTIRVQQAAQRFLVEHAGQKWMSKEVKRRLEGRRPSYRVVKAAKGEFHKPAMRDWSRLMRQEEAWDGLPEQFRRHDLSIQSYRGLAAALCTKYQLEVKVMEAYPFKGYLLLDDSSLGSCDMAALEIQQDFERDPCTLCPQWFAHCQEFPTAETLLQPKSVALVACRGDEAELDNWGVESHNANLYRTIKKAVQQKLAKVQDVSAGWILRNDRLMHTQVWGDIEYPADIISTAASPTKSLMTGGGGGVCRAYVSLLAPDHLRADGRTDFAAIMAKYKVESQKEHSAVLESLKEVGLEATRARREQFKHGERWHMSSFGKVRPQALKSEERKAELRHLMAALIAPSVPAPPASGDLGGGQIVPCAVDPSLVGRIVAVAGEHLPDQLALLRRVGRHRTTQERKSDEAVVKEVRESLAVSKPLLGKRLPVSQSSSSSLRTLDAGMFFDIFFHEDVCSDVMRKVSAMCKHAPVVVKACEALWHRDHEMVTESEAPTVGTIPASAKPTYCHANGAGLCICKGRGLLARIMAENLARAVCSRAPKDSELRKLLKQSYVVFHIGQFLIAAGTDRIKVGIHPPIALNSLVMKVRDASK